MIQRGQIQLRGWIRWKIQRAQVRRRVGSHAMDSLPIVFGNAIPKNGSKLLFNILRGLPKVGPFVDTGLNAIKPYLGGKPTPSDWILRQLAGLKPGDVRLGYLHSTDAYLQQLCRPAWAVFQIMRDPRDTIISGIYYALDVNPQQILHDHYRAMEDMEERISSAIGGVPDGKYQLANIRTIYERYQAWLGRPEICVLRFEDLVHEPIVQLHRLLDHLESRGFHPQITRSRALEILQQQMDPRKSGTFRKGESGGWRQHFTERNKAQFKALTGDLLIRLGYERDMDW